MYGCDLSPHLSRIDMFHYLGKITKIDKSKLNKEKPQNTTIYLFSKQLIPIARRVIDLAFL